MNKKQSSENLITLANCKSCNYFYGKINNNRYLNCALYPFSPPSEICPDWRQRSISHFLLELSFFDSPAIAKMQQQLNTNRKLGLISEKIFLKQETLMIKVFKKKYPLKKKILSNKLTRYSEIIKIVSEWSKKNWLDFYYAVVFEELGGYFWPLTMILLLPLYPFFYFFYARNFSWQAKKHYKIDIEKDVNANQILQLKKAVFLATIDFFVDLAATEK